MVSGFAICVIMRKLFSCDSEGLMAGVCLEEIRKVYDNGHVAVAGATFEAADGEFLVLVGPVSYTHLTLPTNREV